ncbi:hypothetical protein GYMLUDRAFT_944687 [Collybiopsis luxurians FD-317 M1]|uniref:Uncharacterized protein n=1 Tax=Collybiopsis luxurians FD-317 M1 TaxID=944289 RepID=A0A0D0C5G5_9AGAR|nr:hypothetical protein GYMLUDRAFT_944687 [Collybiopsis luxurians FD-317 M1]
MCFRSVNYAKYTACGHEQPIDAGVDVDCNRATCFYSQAHRAKGPCFNCQNTCTHWKAPHQKHISYVNGYCPWYRH